MDLDFAKALVEESPEHDLTLRENYSGRYGNKTAGVVFPDWKTFCEALVYLTNRSALTGDPDMDADTIAYTILRMRTDDMGRSIIAY